MKLFEKVILTTGSMASLVFTLIIFITVRNEHHQTLDRIAELQTELRYGSLGAPLPAGDDVVALRQETPCPGAGARTLVLLAIGQSNASNYAAERSRSTHGGHVVEFFHGHCYVAQDPSIGGDGSAGTPWVLLANTLVDRGAYDDVTISVSAVGGSPIREWRRGGGYNLRLADTGAALAAAGLPVTVVAWVQGEAERGTADKYHDSLRYVEALTEVIATAREHAPQAAFYVALTSWCPGPGGRINSSIREAQASVVQPAKRIFQGPDLDAISAFEDRFDVCHLSAIGLHKFVAEWADIMDPTSHTMSQR